MTHFIFCLSFLWLAKPNTEQHQSSQEIPQKNNINLWSLIHIYRDAEIPHTLWLYASALFPRSSGVSEPFHLLQSCTCRRRSKRRSQRMQEQQGASLMSLSVTNAWVSSTTTFGSLIRGGLCGASGVSPVSLSLARRAPECRGTGSCSPLMSWVRRMTP